MKSENECLMKYLYCWRSCAQVQVLGVAWEERCLDQASQEQDDLVKHQDWQTDCGHIAELLVLSVGQISVCRVEHQKSDRMMAVGQSHSEWQAHSEICHP